MAEEQSAGPLQLLQVKYGDRVTRKSVVYHGFADTGEADADLAMDYNFWVVRAPDQIVLIDTGYDIAAKDWLGEIPRVHPLEGLTRLGIEPADVDMVIASHFHYDHVGFVASFPNAQVIASQVEWDYWRERFAANGLEGEFVTVADLSAIEAAHAEGRLQLVDGPTEVRPGITVYPVGGHCPGQMFAVVDTGSGPRIVASDAVHFSEQVERDWAFFAHTDLAEMRAALRTIRELGERIGAPIIPGHDARVRAKYPSLDGPAGDIVTVLG